ncbi:MAG TPA: DUF6504 family protein [Humibacillus sp.]|nr:DUF6504 family protein [Humibacillus sp.]
MTGVEPAAGNDGDVCDPMQPEAFIWRGRLYVVREVLATWRERRAWWREALDADDAQVRPGETLAAAARERQVWRVEASPGWSFTPGVYDLAHDEPGSGSRPRSHTDSRPRSLSSSHSRSRSGSQPTSQAASRSGSRSRARSGSGDGLQPESGWSLVRVAD